MKWCSAIKVSFLILYILYKKKDFSLPPNTLNFTHHLILFKITNCRLFMNAGHLMLVCVCYDDLNGDVI